MENLKARIACIMEKYKQKLQYQGRDSFDDAEAEIIKLLSNRQEEAKQILEALEETKGAKK